MLKDSYRQVPRDLWAAAAGAASAEPAAGDNYREKSRLPAARFFYDRLQAGLRGVIEHSGNQPVIGYLCNGVPEEMIMACDAVPVRLCAADPAWARVGEQLVPADICPVVKSLAGAFTNAFWRRLDLLVVPATCDGKVQLAQWLDPGMDLYFLDLPRQNDYLRNGDRWAEDYAAFYRFLGARYGRKPARHKLAQACALTNHRTRVFRAIAQFRADHPGRISAGDYFALAAASFLVGAAEWTARAEQVLAEARQPVAPDRAPSGRKRLLLAGSPVLFPNFKILDVLEQAGCDVAADVVCSAYGRLYDPVVIDEDTEDGLVRALALKHLAASLCPCFIGAGKLMDVLVDRVRTLRLDGVVYYSLRLCAPYDIPAGFLHQVCKREGIPFLAVNTDLGREDLGQLRTRVEAFVEMLQ